MTARTCPTADASHEVSPLVAPATGVHRKVDPAEVLALCGHPVGATPRRGLCHRCYRKLSEAGCPLPPKLAPGPTSLDPLVSWIRSLPDDVRRRIAAPLMEAT